ncbi:hypothetical protein DDZ13_08240 [Coraliomargarita sinensis]|uniref:Endonuclease/exonuclease/phosphatase domain-containing protein n=1 Tax=Coraliomargarita sinensis TaxID=2174842 RepID=A0A317ZEU5_9BACT|nr:endonuclease/exonuclease/phosphatase family protein [Coraliomargarita sinensis]PXA04024.1 hypothetical protein DDZ13_08240 [Coraliomargarita sinensis]
MNRPFDNLTTNSSAFSVSCLYWNVRDGVTETTFENQISFLKAVLDELIPDIVVLSEANRPQFPKSTSASVITIKGYENKGFFPYTASSSESGRGFIVLIRKEMISSGCIEVVNTQYDDFIRFNCRTTTSNFTLDAIHRKKGNNKIYEQLSKEPFSGLIGDFNSKCNDVLSKLPTKGTVYVECPSTICPGAFVPISGWRHEQFATCVNESNEGDDKPVCSRIDHAFAFGVDLELIHIERLFGSNHIPIFGRFFLKAAQVMCKRDGAG